MEPMKMDIAHPHKQVKVKFLYEASYQGSVSILNALIQQDPLILHRISSQTTFVETPLHISSLLGHLEFSKALLTHKPKLALELNSFQSTALHLASAEGHIEIVKELLIACDEACLVSDQQGMIPLHYAVMRDRLEVVIELIRAKPESLSILHKGNTIFLLCVIYNRLKILKALVELDTANTYELLSSIDSDGNNTILHLAVMLKQVEILKALVELDTANTYELLSSIDSDGNNTILHLAVMLKQVEIVRYLFSVPKIREIANLENKMGYTAHDIVRRVPQDLESLEIELTFMNTTCIESDENKRMEITPITALGVEEEVTGGRPKKKSNTEKIFKRMGKWFKHSGNWLEEMRGNLSLVATVIATMTFQVAINPPGGFIQQGINDSKSKDSDNTGPLDCLPRKVDNVDYMVCPGDATLASLAPDPFSRILIYSTISFVASLGITLLLVSGVPLKNKVVMWTLCVGMCITLSALALTYFNGLFLISRDIVWFSSTYKVANVATLVWVALLGVVALYIILGVVIWVVKKCVKIIKHRVSECQRNKNGNVCLI